MRNRVRLRRELACRKRPDVCAPGNSHAPGAYPDGTRLAVGRRTPSIRLPMTPSRPNVRPTRPARAASFLAVPLLTGALAGAPLHAQDAADPVGPVFVEEILAPGVYAALVVPRPDAYAFANSLVVVGDDGVLVVDTQQSPRAARALIERIRAWTDLPVRWVVNTHWHGDHVYGNAAYREAWPQARFYATSATLEGMRGPGAAMRAEELESLPASIDERQAWLEAGALPDGRELTDDLREQVAYSLRLRSSYLAELRDLEIVEPDVLVDERLSVDVGGRRVVLHPMGSAHTEGDLAVEVPDAGVVAVGDLLEEAAPWIEGAYLEGWAGALAEVRSLRPSVVLPAHGGVARNPALLDGAAALFDDLTRVAFRERDRPTSDAIAAVTEALEAHRGFLATLGVADTAFDRWAAEAARQAVEQARDEG